MFFKVYYFQSFKKKYFVKKIKKIACSFFNAHSVGLSKFLTKINSKLFSLEDWLYLVFLKTRRKINILLQTYKRYNGHMQGTVFTKVFTNL